MPILVIITFLLIYILFFGSELYVRMVMRQNSGERLDLSGNGHDLAEYLLKNEQVTGVSLELTRIDDHYDASKQAIRLKEEHYKGKSLTACAVAAHLFAESQLHFNEDAGFKTRILWLNRAKQIERWAAGLILSAPAIFYFVRSTHLMLGCLALGFIMISARALVHLMTLPLEAKASKIAYALLAKTMNERDEPAIKRLLSALELRLLAKSLADILNPWSWVKLLKG
jgi:uncharacterized protein